jgi:cysteine desulfurase/selenocysteine lyase
MPLDSQKIRQEFPALRRMIAGKPLVYLDSAATAQKPQSVMDAMSNFYAGGTGNIHRGMHPLAEEATVAYEGARAAVQHFLHAQCPEEIVFTKSCTESINLVARCWTKRHIGKGDAIVLTLLEHHSNIVPWLQIQEETGCEIRWVDTDEQGLLRLDELEAFLAQGNVRLVAMTGLSNVLGVQPPLSEIIAQAHRAGTRVLVDAAQLVAHRSIDVQALDCDFLAFSGHKLYGPFGIGVLYGKRELLEEASPWLGGGMMIRDVRQDGCTPADIPQKFEGGTMPIAEALGLRAAIGWLNRHPWEEREEHERNLLRCALDELGAIEGLNVFGPKDPQVIAGCVSFTIEGIHPHDLTDVLGQEGVCLRAGHHCAQPLHRRLGIPATTRLSIGLYNTREEIAVCAHAIREAADALRR